MSRYIDADALIEVLERYDDYAIGIVNDQPTVDVVEKFIDELTKEISDRVIQALEANYEIIPKKPVVRCKDCKYWRDTDHTCRLWGGASPRLACDYCSRGERGDE